MREQGEITTQRDTSRALSRRQLVLKLVQETVGDLGRAVRAADVLERAAQNEETSGIAAHHITHALVSLVQTGHLRVLDAVRGDGRGMNLYLPAEADEEQFLPVEPLTWLDAVLAAFTQLWQEHERQAAAEGRLPRPVSTSELRAFMETAAEPHPKLQSPPLLTNALKQLAGTDTPSIRRVARAGRRWANLWALAAVPDDRLDQEAYASNTERAAVAVARAVARLGRPVTAHDVADEFEADLTLRPAGEYSTARLLTEAAKDCIGGAVVKGRRKRTRRVHRHVFRVGNLNGTAYYCSDPEEAGVSRAYVSFLRLKARWAEERPSEQLDDLEGAAVPSIAAGRAMLVRTAAKSIAEDLGKLLDEPLLYAETRLKALNLRADVEVLLQRAEEWLSARALSGSRIPNTVSTSVPGWTAEELLRVLRPLYPRAAEIETPHELVRLLHGDIRRLPNPAFGSRFLLDPLQAAEFLFDRTDALLYIAKQWGGLECCMQANLACHALGRLRDVRFVFPALESESIDERLTAISCLAFLRSDEGNDHLKQVAMKDREDGARASALWAYKFVGGEWAGELADVMRKHDPSAEVREFAAQVYEADAAGIWRL